jgi:hypothetical protein
MAINFWLAYATVAVVILSSASIDAEKLQSPLPPTQDPFYTAPIDFARAAPGTVLSIRPAPGNLTSVIGNSSAAYNLLYRTTDSNYHPSWAITTLFVPSKPAKVANCSSPGRGSGDVACDRLLSYQIAYDSPEVDSSPSYNLYSGPSSSISEALNRGWFVNVPDHEGPLASFLAGVHSGHATLDSIRAVLSYANTLGLSANPRIALRGYSGGASASAWAAELQTHYAPELKISGMALGGTPGNATSVLFAVNRGTVAGLIPSGLIGLSRQNPDLYQHLMERLKPSGPFNRTGFFSIEHMDYSQWIPAFGFQNIFDYFTGGIEDLLAPIPQRVINNDAILGYHGIPRMPLYFHHAVGDPVCPIKEIDSLVRRYCGIGARILYHRNSIGDHSTESVAGNSRIWSWLDRVVSGLEISDRCEIMEISESVNIPTTT